MALLKIGLMQVIVFLLMVTVCLAQDLEESPMPVIPKCGQITVPETVLLDFTVEPDLATASFIMVRTCNDSVLDMGLESPSGIKYDSSVQPPVIYGSEGVTTYYIVPNPEPGDWTVAISARAVCECNESYCVVLDTSEDAGETVVGVTPVYGVA